MLVWSKGTGFYDANGIMIAAVQSVIVSEQQTAKTSMSSPGDETYIGGISSINLKVTGGGIAGSFAGAIGATTGGYGVYATNRRIFVIHNTELDASRDQGIQFGTFIMDELFGISVDTRPRTIPELEKLKVFEVWSNDITGIEMKRPMLLAGFLNFKTMNGESFQVYIDHRKAFMHLEQLLKLFYPEILRIE